MDNKVKLFAVASVIAVFVSGCSGYNNQGANGGDGYTSSQSSNSSQVGSSGQVGGSNQTGNTGYGQRRPAAVANTCVPCARPKTTYTYKPKPKVVYKPKPKVVYRAPQPKVVYRQPKVIYKPQPKVIYRPQPKVVYRPQPKPKVVYKQQPVQQYNQQYYVDRWNKQQTQKKPVQYKSYSPVVAASSTTYYDYSTAGKTKYKPPVKARSVAVSNKSIYTGSYQKTTYKPYKPKTYTVGARSTYNANTSSYNSNTIVNKKTVYSGSSTAGKLGGGSYLVKKGDTVFEIMRQTGVYWKDIIRINHLSAPYSINPGQTIRLK